MSRNRRAVSGDNKPTTGDCGISQVGGCYKERFCPPVQQLPVIDSEELLQGAREVLIVHGQTVYRLRRTKSDKLILYK